MGERIGIGLYQSLRTMGKCDMCLCFGCGGVGGVGAMGGWATWPRVWEGGVVLSLCLL